MTRIPKPNMNVRPPKPPPTHAENLAAGKALGKGKEPIDVDYAKLAKKHHKLEIQAAQKANFDAAVSKQAKLSGAGPSGTAHEKPSAPSTPTSSKGSLSRSNSAPASSDFGSSLSDIHLPSTPSGSPVPSWAGGRTLSAGSRTSSGLSDDIHIPTTPTSPDWPATRPGQMNFDQTMPFTPDASQPNSPHGSESSSQGSPRLSRSMSESSKSSLKSQDVRNFQEEIHKAGKLPGTWNTGTTRPVVDKGPLHNQKIVVGMESAGLVPAKPLEPFKREITNDPLNTNVSLPEIGSGPSTPAKHPTPDQAGRPTFARTPSTDSVDHEIPATNWDFTQNATAPTAEGATGGAAAAKKKPALATMQKVGLGTLAAGAAAAVILPNVLGSDDSSKQGDGSVQT